LHEGDVSETKNGFNIYAAIHQDFGFSKQITWIIIFNAGCSFQSRFPLINLSSKMVA